MSALALLRDEREQHQESEGFASALQRILLPPALPSVPGLDLACHYHSASRVGGDFYDVFFVGSDRWAFFLGDVQGHGLEAAVVTSHVRYVLRSAAAHYSDPGDVLSALNRSLLEPPSADRFCTLAFGLLERDASGDWTVTIATGGHLPGLWIRPLRARVVSVLPSDGMLVGAVPEASFGQATMSLSTGETLLFYTDGLTESRVGDGRLGEEGLVTHLRHHSPVDAHSAVEMVERLIDDLSPTDDVAVLAFSPAAGTVSRGPG